MVFGLLHQPPKVDSLNLSLADINGMEEGLAAQLWDRLIKARERTLDAYKKR